MMNEAGEEAGAENGDECGDGEKKKRHRRKFAELERIFTCPYRDCGRPYASDHSLQQHIRIKVCSSQRSKQRWFQALSPVTHPLQHTSPANSPYSRRARAISMPMRQMYVPCEHLSVGCISEIQ
jgi:transcription elongation factor Elf1